MRAAILVLLALTSLLPVMVAAQPVAWSVNSDGSGGSGEPAAGQLLDIPLSSGPADPVGDTGYADIEGLASAPDGRLFGIDDFTKTLLTIDTASGAASSVNGTLGNVALSNAQDPAIAFDCSGELWMATGGDESLYQVDPGNGDLTLVGSLGAPITALTATQQGLFGLGTSRAEGFYRIDPSSGAATRIGSLGLGHGYSGAGLTVDASGRFWAVFDRSNPSGESTVIARIDAQSGEATPVGTTVTGLESLALPYDQQCATAGGQAQSIPVLSRGLTVLFTLLLVGVAALTLSRQR